MNLLFEVHHPWCLGVTPSFQLWSPFRYCAATLVINWLSSHEDPTLQRMAVAVICLLVSKVTPLL